MPRVCSRIILTHNRNRRNSRNTRNLQYQTTFPFITVLKYLHGRVVLPYCELHSDYRIALKNNRCFLVTTDLIRVLIQILNQACIFVLMQVLPC